MHILKGKGAVNQKVIRGIVQKAIRGRVIDIGDTDHVIMINEKDHIIQGNLE